MRHRSGAARPHPLRFFSGMMILMLAIAAYTPGSPLRQVGILMGRSMRVAVSLVAPPRNMTKKINVPFHQQEHALSCEVASLRSALLAVGVDVPEAILLSALPRDTTSREISASGEITWGDPEKGFVGDIDGEAPSTGYGVHALPIAEVAQLFYADALMIRADDAPAIIAAVDAQHPVIVWTAIGDDPQPLTWKTPHGVTVDGARTEHTAVINGYRTDVSGRIVEMFLVDPLTGYRSEPWEEYARRTALLGHQAVELMPKSLIAR